MLGLNPLYDNKYSYIQSNNTFVVVVKSGHKSQLNHYGGLCVNIPSSNLDFKNPRGLLL